MIPFFDYVLKNFSLFYKMNGDEFGIQYGNSGDGKVTIIQSSGDFFFDDKRDINFNEVIWKEWKGKPVPFCFDNSDSGEIITEANGVFTINYDIIASSFYFLSGWNEFVSGDENKDELGRFTYEGSMINKLGIVSLPVVNYYFDILKTAIESANDLTIGNNFWGGNQFAAALTHDIDNCKSAWLEGSLSEMKKGRIFSAAKLISKRFFSKDDWFNFDQISETEKQFDAASVFYFLPKKGSSGKYCNADYDIESPEIRNVIKDLSEKGNEIGVHGSFGSHLDDDKLRTDIKKIDNEFLTGNRFHFLMFDIQKTVSVLESADIKYDTSLGFSEQIGFRRGTCFPFYLYNFEKNRISNVIEIPLIIMDATLRNSMKYRPADDRLTKEIETLIDETKKFHGVLTILWHNNYFSDFKYKGWKEVYIKILEKCKENNALLSNAGFIYKTIAGKTRTKI